MDLEPTVVLLLGVSPKTQAFILGSLLERTQQDCNDDVSVKQTRVREIIKDQLTLHQCKATVDDADTNCTFMATLIDGYPLFLRKSTSLLEDVHQLVKDGTIDSICIVHDRVPEYDALRTLYWSRWSSFLSSSCRDLSLFILSPVGNMKGEHVNRPNFDMFRDARMFLFPEQDDSNQTKQHIVNQLFKSIAVDTTSRFRSVLNRFVLRRTIEMLLEKIQDLEESARAQGARFKEQRNKLTSELSENAEALRVAEGRLSYLDTKDHELLCELTRKHEFKLRRPTPNFTFDHNSDFPVRHVLKEKSEKSIWAPDESELGTKRYIAVLRNRPLTRAFGKVQLFGWRKEMHHVEITSLRNSLSKLRGVKGNVDSQLQDVRNSLVAVNKTVTRCRVQRDACISNLRLLDLPYLASWPLSLVLGLLRDDNVHGLAKVYGLTGQFLKSSLGLSDSDGPSEISFQTHQTMVDVLAQHLEGNRAMLDDLASKRISLQQSYPFDRKGEEQPLNSSLTSLSLASTEGSTHVKGIAEEACSIVTSFALSMQDLQNSQLQLLSEIEANVQGAEETYSRQVRLISDTRFERQCGKEILSLIKGQSLPIGGFASLLNQESSVEAYISMFEGERAVRP